MSSLDVSSLEYFISQGYLGYFYIPILVEISSFSTAYKTATFKLSHAKLKGKLESFYDAWKATQEYGAFFCATSNPNLYRFNLPLDLPRSEQERTTHENYLSSISALEAKFKELVLTIRKYSPSLDLHLTSEIARNGRSIATKELPHQIPLPRDEFS